VTTPAATLYGYRDQSQNNVLETKAWNYYAAATWTLGDHDLKFGVRLHQRHLQLLWRWLVACTPSTAWTISPRAVADLPAEQGKSANSIAADYKYSNLGCSCRTPGTSTAT
jgi:hypothetical protein